MPNAHENPLPVLEQTDRWAVLAKPSGLAIHRSKMVHDPVVLVDLAREQFQTTIHPVHRLDRATSGCLLIAFDSAAARYLQASLREGTKTYLAFCRGHITQYEPVTIDKPMKDDNGILRDASTWLRCLASCPDPRSSLVLAKPKTGRYHQVRRHIRDLSHPVLGDAMHGDTRVNRWWRERYGLPRLGLHCLSLELTFPDGVSRKVTAPLPDDLRTLWERLPWWSQARKELESIAPEAL